MPQTPRAWAIGSSRDERIDGSPQRGHTAKFVEKKGAIYRCVIASCLATCNGPAMFCDTHLWNLDHPTLQAVNHPE